jgi:hypothetical protein
VLGFTIIDLKKNYYINKAKKLETKQREKDDHKYKLWKKKNQVVKRDANEAEE